MELMKIIEHNEIYREELDKVIDEERVRLDKKDDKLLDREVSNKNNKEFDIIAAYNKKVASLKAKFLKVS